MEKEILDVLYIHSPITYSIGHQLESSGRLTKPLVMGGRKTAWHSDYIQVHDDGMWDIDRTCDFLDKLVQALPDNDQLQLDVYLPHTGFLLGKLLKLSPVVRRIFYIEEGDTSCDPGFTKQINNVELSVDELHAALSRRGIAKRLRLGLSRLQNINAMQAVFFDGHNQKYGGSYGISADAFPTLSNVEKLHLEERQNIPGAENIWVCLLPNVINMAGKYKTEPGVLDKILYGLVILIRTQNALAASFSASLLLKFHPNDETNLNDELKSDIFKGARSYLEFFDERHLDPGYEPALYNFGKYIVVNESAASRYVELLRGEEKLVRITLN
jgi:hypothetical protein